MTSIVEAASDFHLSDTLSLRFAGVQNNNQGNEVKNIRTGVNEDHKYVSGRLVFHGATDALSVRFKYQNMEVTVYPQPVAGAWPSMLSCDAVDLQLESHLYLKSPWMCQLAMVACGSRHSC